MSYLFSGADVATGLAQAIIHISEKNMIIDDNELPRQIK
jgi:hypothetical protein